MDCGCTNGSAKPESSEIFPHAKKDSNRGQLQRRPVPPSLTITANPHLLPTVRITAARGIVTAVQRMGEGGGGDGRGGGGDGDD